MSKTPVRKTPRRRRKAVQEEHVSYLTRITGWDYYYSLRVSDPKSRWDRGAYSELRTLSLSGTLIRPERTKYEECLITLSARTNMLDEEPGIGTSPLGTPSANGNKLSAYVFVPGERLAELIAVAQAGQIQIAHIIGSKLRYRSGLISNISFDSSFNEDEW